MLYLTYLLCFFYPFRTLIADDGTKLVIFGGRYFETFSQNIMGDMYVLDLDTMVWTRGPDYTTPRIYTTCTIVDDTFLSWGGNTTFAAVKLFLFC